MAITAWLATASTLWSLKQEIKKLEEQESELKEQLKLLSNNQSHMEAPYIFKKEMRNGTIEYNKIEILKTINLDMYRKPSVESWKIDRI